MRARLVSSTTAALNELCQMRNAFVKLVPRTVDRDHDGLQRAREREAGSLSKCH